jgi:hypothetical protein
MLMVNNSVHYIVSIHNVDCDIKEFFHMRLGMRTVLSPRLNH